MVEKNKSDTIKSDRIALVSTMEVFFLGNQNISIIALLIDRNYRFKLMPT